MPPGDAKANRLRRWLVEQGRPQRVSAYDRYGGPLMEVNLQPSPTAEQITALTQHFGDAFRFVDEPQVRLRQD
jgi:hypothetical protein